MELGDIIKPENPVTVTRPDGIRIGYGAGTILNFDQLGEWLLDYGNGPEPIVVTPSTKPRKRPPGPVKARKR